MSLRSGISNWWLHHWAASLVVVLLSFISITIPGCGGSGSSSSSGTAGVQLTQIDVEPSTSAIAKGTSQVFTATGIYSDGSSQDITAQASWTSSDSNVATINNIGSANVSASSVAAGTSTITAALSGVSADTTLTVTNAVLNGLQITPGSPSIANGTSASLTVTGQYSDGTHQDLTSQVTWQSSNTSIATVDSSGVVAAVGVGSATITATLGTTSASVNLTVSSALLSSIDISTQSNNIANGGKMQATAVGTFTDGSTQDITKQVTWASSQTSVATVGDAAASKGLISALSTGTTNISATLFGVAASVSVTVTNATLSSINITTQSANVPAGVKMQATAVGTFSDGSIQDITGQVTWISSQTSVATVSNSTASEGLITALAAGTTTISATLSGITTSLSIRVTNAALASINITSASGTVPIGTMMQASAVGTFSDGSTQDITGQVTWTSSQTSVATVSNASGTQGLITGQSPGAANIVATLASITASIPITVTNATLASINVSPPSLSIADGVSTALTATGNYSDGSTLNITNQVSWLTSDASVIQVSNATGSKGRVTAVAPGSAVVNATLSGVTGTSRVTVTSATLSSIEVTPTSPSVAVGLKIAMHATGHFSDSSTQDITDQVTWQSSDDGIAVVSNAANTEGEVTAVSVGAANITASLGAVTSSPIPLTVTNAQLSSIQVTPANPAVVKGGTVQLTATGTFTDTTQQDITSQVVWSSSDTAVATVSNAYGSNGLVSGTGAGSSSLTATYGSVQGGVTLSVSVDPNSPVSLTAVASPNIILNDGTDASTISVTVEPVDSTGSIVDGTRVDFQVTQGTGALSAASATTVSGVASVTLTSTSSGVVTVTATVQGTGISNYAPVYVTAHLYDALGKSIIFSASKDSSGNVLSGSAFGFYIMNFSNRPFDLTLYQFSDGPTTLYSTSSPTALNGGHLLPGESTGIIFQLSTDQSDQGLQAHYLLTDPATTTSFGVSVAYVIP